MNPGYRLERRAALRVALAMGIVAMGCAAATSAADDAYLVLVDGGVQAIDGGWTEKSGRVTFTRAGI